MAESIPKDSFNSFFQDLPDYMGFGIMDIESIQSNGYEFSVNYNFNGSPVHQVAYRSVTGYHITDIYEGKMNRSSISLSFREAFFKHFVHNDYKEMKCLFDLLNLIINQGNIYFEIPEFNDDCVFYQPAALLFEVRLVYPLGKVSKHFKKRLMFSDKLWDAFHFSYSKCQHAHLLTLNLEHEVVIEQIEMHSFSTELARLYEVTRLFSGEVGKMDLILPEFKYRMFINHLNSKFETNFCIYRGYEKEGSLALGYLSVDDINAPIDEETWHNFKECSEEMVTIHEV